MLQMLMGRISNEGHRPPPHIWAPPPRLIFYGSRNGNRSWTTAHTVALHESAAQVFVNKLRAVGGNVDVFGRKLSQLFNRKAQVFKPRTFQGGQHLE